jgi:hypothetical protein
LLTLALILLPIFPKWQQFEMKMVKTGKEKQIIKKKEMNIR